MRQLIAKIFGCLAIATGLLASSTARAEFSRPPEPSPYRPEEPEPYRPDEPRDYQAGQDESRWWTPRSTVRFHVGPALLMQPTSPGLFTAIDIGQRAVGGRLSGAWLRSDSSQGLSAYSAELWIDFRHRNQLHPILGAGASWLHGAALGDSKSAGAGLLRGTLEYELPIEDSDARLGLSVLAFVPAIGTERTRPWASLALTVGAGF